MQKKTWKWLKAWHFYAHLRLFSESCPMNTSMTGFQWFKRSLRPHFLDESSLSIGSVIFIMNYDHSRIPGVTFTMCFDSQVGSRCKGICPTRLSDLRVGVLALKRGKTWLSIMYLWLFPPRMSFLARQDKHWATWDDFQLKYMVDLFEEDFSPLLLEEKCTHLVTLFSSWFSNFHR